MQFSFAYHFRLFNTYSSNSFLNLGGKSSGASIQTASAFVNNTSDVSASPSQRNNFHKVNTNVAGEPLTHSQFSQIKGTQKQDVLVPGLTLYLPLHGDIEWKNAVCILHESCQKCNIFIEVLDNGFKQISKGQFLFSCVILIITKEIATGYGTTKKEAKNDAARKALTILLDKQPIINKADINHDNLATVEKGTLVKQCYENAPKIDDNNLGNKLLRKMGWKGSGGVGKYESGLEEPVFINAAEGRKGVGHEFKNRAVKRASVEEALLDFIRNDQPEIRFSADLNPEERALIHRRCQKFGLKHKSYGAGEDRYLVVSKKPT